MKEEIKSTIDSFSVPAEILYNRDVTANEKIVYITLCSFTNVHSAQAWPSIKLIVYLSGLSESTVHRCIASLTKKGFLEKKIDWEYDPMRKTARQTSNIYTLTRPGVRVTPPRCQSDTPPVSEGHPPRCQSDTLIYQDRISQKNIDDDDRLHHESIEIWEKYKGQIEKERFDIVFERVKKANKHRNAFKSMLEKSVLTEIEKIAASMQTDEKGSGRAVAGQRRAAGRKKPEPKIAGSGTGRKLSEEEIEAIIQMGKSWAEKDKLS